MLGGDEPEWELCLKGDKSLGESVYQYQYRAKDLIATVIS